VVVPATIWITAIRERAALSEEEATAIAVAELSEAPSSVTAVRL
jgi:hypothetical protein